ncbi:intradiol ring-cleavage dioxygenase [Actinoplanes sp. NPDC051851]|uniref:dioxygenase family protein n=1 Tax=Actinoplanes sp. NPDC051851 TaxID=3154753 RepID=UPI003412AD70
MQDKYEQDNEAYVRAVHDKGLAFDLRTMSRRRMLGVFGGAGALALTGGALLNGMTAEAAEAVEAACLAEVESETEGPYPADGSNGPDVRIEDGIVRSDITSSFGSYSGTADGVPLTFSLTVQNLSCSPLAGAAVYVWHCSAEGRYSLYSLGARRQNYLRGIQVADSTGKVTFTSIFPGCYTGRWPHIHFEVYASLADATSGSGAIRKTSQIALPEAVSEAVYAGSSVYSGSTANLDDITLATDGVFGDDLAAREMATVTGSVSAGYVANLTISVDPTGTELTTARKSA